MFLLLYDAGSVGRTVQYTLRKTCIICVVKKKCIELLFPPTPVDYFPYFKRTTTAICQQLPFIVTFNSVQCPWGKLCYSSSSAFLFFLLLLLFFSWSSVKCKNNETFGNVRGEKEGGWTIFCRAEPAFSRVSHITLSYFLSLLVEADSLWTRSGACINARRLAAQVQSSQLAAHDRSGRPCQKLHRLHHRRDSTHSHLTWR